MQLTQYAPGDSPVLQASKMLKSRRLSDYEVLAQNIQAQQPVHPSLSPISLALLNQSTLPLMSPSSPSPVSSPLYSQNNNYNFWRGATQLDSLAQLQEKKLRRYSSTSSLFNVQNFVNAAQWQQVLDVAARKVNTHSDIPVSYALKPEPVFTVCPPATDRIKGRVYVVRGALKKWDGKRFARCCKDVRCTKLAQGPTSYCKAHGGGTRCKTDGCKKAARGGSDHCAMHGGGKRCGHNDCTKAAVGNFFCRRHSKLLDPLEETTSLTEVTEEPSAKRVKLE